MSDETPISVVVTFDSGAEMAFDLDTENWEDLDFEFKWQRHAVWRGVNINEAAIAFRLDRVLSIRSADD